MDFIIYKTRMLFDDHALLPHYIEGIRAQYHSEPVPQPPAVMPIAYVK